MFILLTLYVYIYIYICLLLKVVPIRDSISIGCAHIDHIHLLKRHYEFQLKLGGCATLSIYLNFLEPIATRSFISIYTHH